MRDKAIIYAILDQDATYRKYIAVNWKDVEVYYNSKQFWSFAHDWKKPYLNICTFIPNDIKKGQTIHIILEVTHNTALPLTRYQRVIVTCK